MMLRAPSFSIITTMTWGADERRAAPGLVEVLERPEPGEVPEALDRPDVLVERAPDGGPEAAQLVNKALEPIRAIVMTKRRLPRRRIPRLPIDDLPGIGSAEVRLELRQGL